MPVELRLGPAWQRDTLTMSHASPARCLWGGFSKAHQRCHKTPQPHIVLPPTCCQERPLGLSFCPSGTSTTGGHGLSRASRNTQGYPGPSSLPRVALGRPLWGLLMARGAAPSSRRGRVPYLTLLRETPALSPLTICFQWLIQETHVLSIYLEKKK